jgi:hypothetical protein
MGLVMVLAALAGAIIQTARSADSGAYGVMCAVGGITYSLSLVAVRRRR